MGQEEIINLLMRNKGTFYTLRELSEALELNYSGICRASKSVVKRDGFVMQIEVTTRPLRRIGYVEKW